jgi:L-lactate dehydrogenase
VTGANDLPLGGKRLAIIGAGHVGATTAYALMLRALFREIVLIDSDAALALAEAADLSDATALARPARIWAGTYADAAVAQIAIITAGAATYGAESRLAIASKSSIIVSLCVGELMGAGFGGIIIVAANPVDLMSLVTFQRSGLPASRVIGTGTLLDTSRLRQDLAAQIGVAPSAIDGLVLGEHGDSEFVAFSTLRVGGLGLDAFVSPADEPNHGDLARRVRDAAYEIIAGKGHTSFGIATAIVRICEAIVRNEMCVLPVSTLLSGQFGIEGIYLSLPCVLGISGVERVLLPQLAPSEAMALRACAAVMQKAHAALIDAPAGQVNSEPSHVKATPRPRL